MACDWYMMSSSPSVSKFLFCVDVSFCTVVVVELFCDAFFAALAAALAAVISATSAATCSPVVSPGVGFGGIFIDSNQSCWLGMYRNDIVHTSS